MIRMSIARRCSASRLTRTLGAALLLAPMHLAAQSSECGADGPVFIGEPTELVIVGSGGAEHQALTPEEGAEYQVVVMCEDGRMVYSSRGNLSVYRVESGCFVQFVAPTS